jgi:hypothetical protein
VGTQHWTLAHNLGTQHRTRPHTVAYQLGTQHRTSPRSMGKQHHRVEMERFSVPSKLLPPSNRAGHEQPELHTVDKRVHTEIPRSWHALFRNSLQAEPALIGVDLHHKWVRKVYPIFCDAVRLDGWSWPPPYKDFANELAKLMPRRRREIWSQGQRNGTFTVYLVPNPEAAVVETVEKLERA